MEVIETPYNYVLTVPVTTDGGSDEILSFYCYYHKNNLIMDINLSSSNDFIYGVSCELLSLDKIPTMAVEESDGKTKQIMVIPLDEDKAQVVITVDNKEEILFINKHEMFHVHDFFMSNGEFFNKEENLILYALKWLFTLPSRLIGWK